MLAQKKTDFNVKWPFSVTQGHVFWVQWKDDEDYILLYNNTGLISKEPEDTATENTEKSPFLSPTVVCRRLSRKPPQISAQTLY